MRILLDECMPRLLRREIIGHEVSTVTDMGWTGIKNGNLLTLAEAQFDVLLTVDRGIEYQQNFASRHIALIVLYTSNRLPDIRPLVPQLLEMLKTIKPGMIAHIYAQENEQG
jgi:hypothetical protein